MKVFFNEKQTVSDGNGFSPSAGKPTLVVEQWKKLVNVEIVNFEPATKKELCLAHRNEFVEGILNCTISNGFGNFKDSVAKSLPWTTGSMIAAGRHALRTGEPGVSPTSGFHHAGYDNSGGFCTFNGLMVTALVLKGEGADRVGILDLDNHYGNGTNNIIDRLDIDFVPHYTFGGERINSPSIWLNELPEIIKNKFSGCDVVLFQAGADAHIEDPLGGSLTTEELRTRDRIVFETLREMDVPVAWNLAGGYQSPIEKVLEIHNNTAMECVRAYEKNKKEAA